MWSFKLYIKRVNAFLVDFFIVYVILTVIQGFLLFLLRLLFGIPDDWYTNGWNIQFYTWLTVSIPSWIYFSVLDSNHSKGTFGKRLLTVQVVDINEDRLPFSKTLLRTILKLLPIEIFYLTLNFPEPIFLIDASYLRMGFLLSGLILLSYLIQLSVSNGSQSMYDKWLKTKVIDKKVNR